MKATRIIKDGLYYIPEILILLVSVYWFLDGLLGSSYINYLMLGIIAFISGLIILKNKFMALFMSIIIGLGSLYMILAVVSEYSEFPAGSAEGLKLLLTGTSIFVTTIIMSIILPIKYFKRGKNPTLIDSNC